MKTTGSIVLVLGVTLILGPIANFNFTLGIEKSAMLITAAIVGAAGAIGMEISYSPNSDRTE